MGLRSAANDLSRKCHETDWNHRNNDTKIPFAFCAGQLSINEKEFEKIWLKKLNKMCDMYPTPSIIWRFTNKTDVIFKISKKKCNKKPFNHFYT